MNKKIFALTLLMSLSAVRAFAAPSVNHFDDATTFNTTVDVDAPPKCTAGNVLSYDGKSYSCVPNSPNADCGAGMVMQKVGANGAFTCVKNYSATPCPQDASGNDQAATGLDASGNPTGCIPIPKVPPMPAAPCGPKQSLSAAPNIFGVVVFTCTDTGAFLGAPMNTGPFSIVPHFSYMGDWCNSGNAMPTPWGLSNGVGTGISMWCGCAEYCQSQGYGWGFMSIYVGLFDALGCSCFR